MVVVADSSLLALWKIFFWSSKVVKELKLMLEVTLTPFQIVLWSLYHHFLVSKSNRHQYSKKTYEYPILQHFMVPRIFRTEYSILTFVVFVGVTLENLSWRLRLCLIEFFHPIELLWSPLSLKNGIFATIQSYISANVICFDGALSRAIVIKSA